MKKLNKYTNITDPFLFVILSIFTFGIYDMIWMYRNWKYFKYTEKTDIMPFWRAWFGLFL